MHSMDITLAAVNVLKVTDEVMLARESQHKTEAKGGIQQTPTLNKTAPSLATGQCAQGYFQ